MIFDCDHQIVSQFTAYTVGNWLVIYISRSRNEDVAFFRGHRRLGVFINITTFTPSACIQLSLHEVIIE